MKVNNSFPLKTILVEDEEASRITLRGLLQMYCPQVQIVAEAANVNSAFAAMQQHNPQLALLDIRLDDRTVFDLLARFDIIDFKIIILTAYPEFEYAQQGIRYGVIDYLLKPFSIDDLTKAVNKVEMETSAAPRSLIVPSSSGQTILPLEQIVLLEADGPYTTIYLASAEKFMVSKNLKHFEDQLPVPPFFRTHDSAIVNFDQLLSYSRDGQTGRAELNGGLSAPISARRLGEFSERLREYMDGK